MSNTSFKFRAYGDSPLWTDFMQADEITPEMEQAKSIVEEFSKKEKEAYIKPDVPFSFSKAFMDARDAASEKTTAALLAAGYQKGKNFIQTPNGRIEWRYLGTKINDPNFADSDVSVYEITIS